MEKKIYKKYLFLYIILILISSYITLFINPQIGFAIFLIILYSTVYFKDKLTYEVY